jgi:hypothetical protein
LGSKTAYLTPVDDSLFLPEPFAASMTAATSTGATALLTQSSIPLKLFIFLMISLVDTILIHCKWQPLCFIIKFIKTQEPGALLLGYNAIHGRLLAQEVLSFLSDT